VFVEWKPAGGDDAVMAPVDEMSAVSSQKDTDWTVVVSDSPASSSASVSYSSEHRHSTQPS